MIPVFEKHLHTLQLRATKKHIYQPLQAFEIVGVASSLALKTGIVSSMSANAFICDALISPADISNQCRRLEKNHEKEAAISNMVSTNIKIDEKKTKDKMY